MVIYPKLYDAGWQTINHLWDTPEFGAQDLLDRWAVVFNGFAIISNHCTPPHWDGSSRANWYDILATLGRYQNCDLKLPGLRISLRYGPGMVVGIAGKVPEHAVLTYEGDRVCIAYFISDNVHEWAEIPCRYWMHTDFDE